MIKKSFVGSACLLVACLVLAYSPGVWAQDANIEVSPASLDFGQVELGDSVTITVTVTNATGSYGNDLHVNYVFLNQQPSADYTYENPFSFDLIAGGQESFDVTFSPNVAGTLPAELEISSNDPNDPTLIISITGVGVDSSSISIYDILDFFDASVADGSLKGTGWWWYQASQRLRMFRYMLVSTAQWLDSSSNWYACYMLKKLYWYSDGWYRPYDLVWGEARPELADMILQLKSVSDCCH